MSAKAMNKSAAFHSWQECRDELDKLNHQLSELERVVDDKLRASYAGHPGFMEKPKPNEKEVLRG